MMIGFREDSQMSGLKPKKDGDQRQDNQPKLFRNKWDNDINYTSTNLF